MADQSTYIKLDRNILRWRWWNKSKTLHVFLFLLLNANVSDHDFENEIIHRGQCVTSLASIVKSTGLTIREVRTAISTLKKTGEVTSRSTNRYQVITIVNYDKYQENRQTKRQANGQPSDKQATSKRQQYKNNKNDKNEKNKRPPKSPKGDNPPSEVPERGTDAFRRKSHLLLKQDEGTVDDIPMVYRDGTYQSFTSFADYWKWRNQ